MTGWSMVLDYLVQPIINVIFCSQQSHVLFPIAPYWAYAVFFTLLFTGLNVQGIKVSARVNAVLAAGMGVVCSYFSPQRRSISRITRTRAAASSPGPFMIRGPGRCPES